MTHTKLKLGRLKKRPEFLYVAKGRYAARKTLVVQCRKHPTRETGINVGFTATKKVGNAVIRNKAKRRLREIARNLLPDTGKEGFDYVFIARLDTARADFDLLVRDAEKALAKLA